MKDERDMDCVVAGDANADLVVRSAAACQPGKETLADQAELVLGGSSAITACNMARMGARVGFAGVVGDDLLGRFVRERLLSSNINLEEFRQVSNVGTGVTIWHQYSRRRCGLTYPGTIGLLRARDVRSAYLERARHLHIGAYFLLRGLHAGAAGMFRRARKLGLTTSLDCNYDPSEKWDSNLYSVLKYTDVFLPNEMEAMRLTGLRRSGLAAEKLSGLARIVIVKRGPRGVLVRAEGQTFHVPAPRVRAVDATGAGDSFNAGFLAGFIHGFPLRECVEAGVNAGARAVARVGGTAAFES